MSHLFLKTDKTSCWGRRQGRVKLKFIKREREGGECFSIITLRKRNGLPFNQGAPVPNDTDTFGLVFS